MKTELEVPESLAHVVYEIWANTLLETRYDRKSYRGLDGGTSLFSTFVRGLGWMHGEIWSPRAELPPKWIEDAAEQISRYASDPNRDPEKLETTMVATRKRLFEYLKERGRH